MEATKRKHEDETKSGDAATASLWFFNPIALKNQSIDLNKNKFLIGRAKEVDFQITTQRVSREHCLIQNVGTKNAPKWELVDKNSSLGTFLNGRKVPAYHPTPLKDGDVIFLSDPDVYPIRFVMNNSKPTKVSKPEYLSFPITNKAFKQDFEDKKIENKVIEIDLTDLDQNDSQLRTKPSIGLFEDTSAKSCDNIINNTLAKTKLTTNNVAGKENSSNEEYKLKLGILNQKLQDQEKEIERLKSQLESKDGEMERISKDMEIIKFFEESNNELIKSLNADLSAKERELENYQQSNSEEAVLLKTCRTFVDLIEAELQCSICNEVIVTASISIPCFHVFCNACISLWFKQKKECAVCRTPSHMTVPCKILDSFIEKLMDMVPDQEYKQKRQQICEERRIQERDSRAAPAPVGPPPPQAYRPLEPRIVPEHLQDHYHAARHMLMDIMVGGQLERQMIQIPQLHQLTIDLTAQDAAANAAGAGPAARRPVAVRRPRSRRGHRTT